MARSAKLSIKVVPSASRTEIAGWMGESLKVRVAAPPEKGKANRAVETVLSKALGIPSRQVRIEAGAGSQRKVVVIEGLCWKEIAKKLGRGAA